MDSVTESAMGKLDRVLLYKVNFESEGLFTIQNWTIMAITSSDTKITMAAIRYILDNLLVIPVFFVI
jgi:hypothetical protein